MLPIRCPRCGTLTSWWPRDLREWRSGKRRCSLCCADLELANPFTVGGLFGLALGLIILAVQQVSVGGEAVREALAAPLCVLAGAAVYRAAGRWQVAADPARVPAQARHYTRVVTYSSWCGALAAGGASLYVVRMMNRSGVRLDIVPWASGYDPMASLPRAGVAAVCVAAAAAVGASVVAVVASVRRARIIAAAAAEEVNDPTDH